MKMSAELVVQSHLSDALIETAFDQKQANHRIRFVKFLIHELNGNLDTRIDPEAMYEEFTESKI